MFSRNYHFDNCIGVFIRSIRITNYFIFINIHFYYPFSHSLKFLGRGRLHDLLAGDEVLVARARNAPEDDEERDSGAWRISFYLSSAKSGHLAPILQRQRDCPTITQGLEEVKTQKKLTKSGLPEALQARRDSIIIDKMFKYV